MMEQRSQMLKQMQLSKTEREREVRVWVPAAPSRPVPRVLARPAGPSLGGLWSRAPPSRVF